MTARAASMNGVVRRLAAGLAAAGLAVGGCAHAPPPPTIALKVECNVADATVFVDDVPAGAAVRWKAGDRRIRAGFHRIEVAAPGYYSVYEEVDLPNGGAAVVPANLRKTLD
jgi:hypothetical protein